MTRTLRLVYPEWQGGWPQNIANCLGNKFSVKDTQLGYNLGSHIMNLVVPESKDPRDCAAEVPISTEYNEKALAIEDHIYAKRTIMTHLSNAISILKEKNPERTVVIGGECAVSVAPFKYMIDKYGPDNVAMIWIDAHPDLIIPGDGDESRQGFHEMPIPHIMGLKGTDKDILNILPKNGNLKPENLLYVGLHIIGDIETKRMGELKLQKLSPEEFRESPQKLNEFIQKTKCKKVVVHLDLDVLEPEELYCAVGREPNGMYIREVIDAMNRISNESEIVALTIAEHMPQIQMKLRNMFGEFSLFK